MMRGGEEGYTLLEVLVAFVILAGAVIMSFRIFGEGLHRLNEADRQVEMVTVAQQLMARLQLGSRLAAGTTTGRVGDLAWTISLTPYPQGEGMPQAQGMALFHARIDIRENEADVAASYSLDTHLLAAVQ
ncbi:MAG: prepilin-type N-terminal cleavage/methylation domain-containing protein [Parvibaculaceae bacterium]